MFPCLVERRKFNQLGQAIGPAGKPKKIIGICFAQNGAVSFAKRHPRAIDRGQVAVSSITDRAQFRQRWRWVYVNQCPVSRHRTLHKASQLRIRSTCKALKGQNPDAGVRDRSGNIRHDIAPGSGSIDQTGQQPRPGKAAPLARVVTEGGTPIGFQAANVQHDIGHISVECLAKPRHALTGAAVKLCQTEIGAHTAHHVFITDNQRPCSAVGALCAAQLHPTDGTASQIAVQPNFRSGLNSAKQTRAGSQRPPKADSTLLQQAGMGPHVMKKAGRRAAMRADMQDHVHQVLCLLPDRRPERLYRGEWHDH